MDSPRQTRIRDRETGELRSERVLGERPLRFLYENPLGRWLTDHLLSRDSLNHFYGLAQRSRISRGRISGFVRRLGIDATEAEKPLHEYRTLDEFFTRKLKAGARPVDRTAGHLVSPADGRVLVYPELSDELEVKGSRITIAELVGDVELALGLRGGGALVVRLAPADYHRFHFPDGGTPSPSRRLGRGLHSVHPIALQTRADSFRNKRMVTRLQSRAFGELILIEVGALIVGTIVQTYPSGSVERGQEKGYFRFGGSTVILLARPNRVVFDEDLVESSRRSVETLVKMGSRIGRRA